jgi:hypothetical protein
MLLTEKDAIYLKDGLDLLFIALNPPKQSNNNGHYFSGRNSTFFKQLAESGLIARQVDKLIADDIVFGDTRYNYEKKRFGVIDLIPTVEETNSNKVKVKSEDVRLLLLRLQKFRPKNVCIIHSEVMRQFTRETGIKLKYGYNGKLLEGLDIDFYCNYFPNGNPIATGIKLEIYRDLKSRL